MHDFQVLSQDEQDDTIVSYYLAQERDLYSLNVNIERFESMLKTLPAGKFRDHITHLLEEHRERKAEIEAIIAATEPQLPPADRLEAAKARLMRPSVVS